ncbi:hypothetical protein BC827DRAFT_1154124 [Russula dissimulans]|nr:hypothetical protein BC827DRAFT_1154124 [Russula dissimulans]
MRTKYGSERGHTSDPPAVSLPSTGPVSSKKGRRMSKDTVSKPMGFVASDADQAEAILTRWGPDGLGKLGDPRWAIPIKARVREANQARAINEVLNALKPEQHQTAILYVSSTASVPKAQNVRLSLTETTAGRPGNSTIRWGGGLVTHPEQDREEEAVRVSENKLSSPEPKRVSTPSLATLERAVSARIFFENLYFPLLRQPPSREQRQLAMEKDMLSMDLSESRKEAGSIAT